MSASGALISKYTFNESGSVVHDSSGVGAAADGSLVGGASMSGDGYLTLDGSSGYANFAHPSKMTGVTDGYTIEAWVLNVDTPVQGQEPLVFGQDSSAIGVTMYRNVFYGYVNGGGRHTEAGYFNPASEMLVTVTYDHASSVVSIYRNGIFSNSTTLPVAAFSASSTMDFVAGTNLARSEYLSGKINEIRYYDGALTEAQVASNYAVGPDVPEPASLALLGLGAAAVVTRRRR